MHVEYVSMSHSLLHDFWDCFTLSLCSGLGLGSVCTGPWPCTGCGMHGTSHCSVRKRGAYWKEFKNAFCLWISQLLSLRKAIAGWGLCLSGRSGCKWFNGDSWITVFLFYFYSIFSLPFLLGELFVQLLYVAVWLISVCWVWSSYKRGKYEWTVLLKTEKNGKSRKLQPGDKATFIYFLFKISRKNGKENRIFQ